MREPAIHERADLSRALARAVDALAGGASPFVAVTGEPGTGRSRMLREAVRDAAERGVRVLAGRGVAAESGYPLGVVHQLAGRLDGAPAPGERAAPVSTGLLHRWCRIVLGAAHRQPVLLVVDDVQWADAPSRHWLQMLLRRRHEAPLGLLVAVNGTHETSGWAVAPAEAGDVVLRTGRLSRAAVTAIVTEITAVAPDRAFAVLARRVTGGNPAVLVATLARLDPSVPPTSAAVPDLRRCAEAVRGARVAAVLDGLGPDLVAALRAAAVCGPHLWPVVDRIGGPGVATGPDVRERLAATGLVRGPDCPQPADRVVADVVLGGMEPDRRRDLFATAVRLALRAGLPEDAVARALLTAPTIGEPPVAELLYRVARRHRARGAHDAAAACAGRALREPVPPPLRGPLVIELATATAWTAPDAAHRMLSRVAVDADPADGTHCTQAADALLADGDTAAARRVLAVAVRRCPAGSPGRPDLVALLRLTDDMGYERPLAEVPAVADPAPPGPAGAPQCGVTGWALAVRGRDRTRAAALAGDALLADPDAGWAPVMPRVMAALTLAAAGHVDDGLGALRPMVLDLARRSGAPPAVLAVSALVELRLGDPDAARRDLRSAVAAARRRPGAGHPLVESGQILLHLADGAVDAAAGVAFARPEVGRDRPGSALLAYARGRVHAAEGRPGEASESFMACGRLLLDRGRANPALVPWRSAASRTLHASGDIDAALRMARDEHRLAVLWGAPGPLAVAAAAVHELRAAPDLPRRETRAPGP